MSYCSSPSILTFLPTNNYHLPDVPKMTFLKLQIASLTPWHTLPELGHTSHSSSPGKTISSTGKKSHHLLPYSKSSKVLKKWWGEKSKPPTFLNDIEGKVWRKSTKMWTTVHVKNLTEYCQADSPGWYVFLSGKKFLRNLQLENFPSEAPFSSNLHHLTSTQDQNQLLTDVLNYTVLGLSDMY